MKEKQQELYSFRNPNAKRVYTKMDTETITQPEFADELDINNLITKHVGKGGSLGDLNLHQGNYTDVSTVKDFQESMEIVAKAEEMWMSVPADIRRRYNDRPENFLRAVHDPKQHNELIELGIMQKKPAPPPAESVNGAAGGTPASKGEAPATAGGAKPGTVST